MGLARTLREGMSVSVSMGLLAKIVKRTRMIVLEALASMEVLVTTRLDAMNVNVLVARLDFSAIWKMSV